MANIQGQISIQGISDAEMIKLYSFKEKAGKITTFEITTTAPNSQAQGPPRVTIHWTTLDGAEAVAALLRDLQSVPTV